MGTGDTSLREHMSIPLAIPQLSIVYEHATVPVKGAVSWQLKLRSNLFSLTILPLVPNRRFLSVEASIGDCLNRMTLYQ